MAVHLPSLEELQTLSYYDILQIELGASQKAVKKAYRRRALDVHPDKCDAPHSEELFAKVFEAYEVLTDESKRKDYDAKLRIQQERRQQEAALDEDRRSEIQRLRQRENDAEKHRNNRRAATQTLESQAKKRMEQEMKRLRREIWFQSNKKSAPSPSSSILEPDDHLSRTVRVRFTSVKESEDNLRLIFEPYGKIEDVVIGKDTALVSFASSSAAAEAVADPELERDFHLLVSFSKALSSTSSGQDSNTWNSFRPDGISHSAYESMVLTRLRNADRTVARTSESTFPCA